MYIHTGVSIEHNYLPHANAFSNKCLYLGIKCNLLIPTYLMFVRDIPTHPHTCAYVIFASSLARKPDGAMKVKARSPLLRVHHPLIPSSPMWCGEILVRVYPKDDDELCLNRVESEETLVEAILTCKSIIKFGYRGERLIEPSSSWFPPQDSCSQKQFYQVRRMIRGRNFLDLFSNL